jgi:hypothetical protein
LYGRSYNKQMLYIIVVLTAVMWIFITWAVRLEDRKLEERLALVN